MREHKCNEPGKNGSGPCNKTFKKLGNLKRHKTDQHRKTSLVFITYDAGARKAAPTSTHRRLSADTRKVRVITSASSTPSNFAVHVNSDALAASNLRRPSLRNQLGPYVTHAQEAEMTLSEDRTVNSPSSPRRLSALWDYQLRNSNPLNAAGQAIPDRQQWPDSQSHSELQILGRRPQSEREGAALSGASPNCSEQTKLAQAEVSKKRRRSSTFNGRAYLARSRPIMPSYSVKQSKNMAAQQRGLEWLTGSGKSYFNSKFEHHLAQWGVRVGHTGTCVLLPEAWKAMQPMELLRVFENNDIHLRGMGRAQYSHSDHATTLARAAAWFMKWPRTGLELDNFLGGGPFKPMDASHTCHHEHCIVHVTYEPADVNLDRSDCCSQARLLRQDSRVVPEHCSKHTPPCLMQVSVPSPSLTRSLIANSMPH